jgi:integrase
LFSRDPSTARRVLEFFTVNIRNPNTRKAYGKAVAQFAAWCEAGGLAHLSDVQPMHVAAYVEEIQERIAPPSANLQLAAIRMLFDWLVVGQVLPMNPASAVRGPKHSVKKGKTPVLAADEARALLDAIDTSTIVGLRDRALISLMTFTFARVGAAAGKMRVEDVYVQGRRTWVRLLNSATLCPTGGTGTLRRSQRCRCILALFGSQHKADGEGGTNSRSPIRNWVPQEVVLPDFRACGASSFSGKFRSWRSWS